MRQRGKQFICYVVERRRWFGWERSPIPFNTIMEAGDYARQFVDDKLYETIVKETRHD